MLKNTGLEIIKRCDGLPIAIKAIGGLLSQREINEHEWEEVLKNPSWSIKGVPDDVNHAIYLSYEDLNPPLRQCFTYISLFSKTTLVRRTMVVNMWISEGFIHGSSDELEEVGEQYFKELILRNLIEPLDKYVNQSACSMHDVVRSFAHYMSRDEALVFQKGQNDFGDLDSVKIRCLCIQTKGSEPNELDWTVVQRQESLRTLLLGGSITFKAHDSLSIFSRLRTLFIVGTKIDALVDSLCELKHLRFLHFVSTNISRLPEGIGNMKFLQYISLRNCEASVQIPSSIIRLRQLRCFDLTDTKVSSIPRGFGKRTNLKLVSGFRGHMDAHGSSRKQYWCSLEELGPISHLKRLQLNNLEDVSRSSYAAKAELAKKHLTNLTLSCTSTLGNEVLVKEKQQIEDVFDELCPPPSLQELAIRGYFGCRLPKWMMSPASVTPLKGLRFLFLEGLACCTQLPDGLCQVPCLEFIQIKRAPAIKYVGPAFLQAQHYHHLHHPPSRNLLAFPRLSKLLFLGMVQWEEWEWEVEANVQAMPLLEELHIHRCKLRCVPTGLTFHATSLRKLVVSHVQHMKSLECFAFVTDLEVEENDDLVRILDLPKLQKLSITDCPKLKVVEGVPELVSIKLKDYYMDTIPEYLREINARRLELDCILGLLISLTLMSTEPEWDKISHIQQVKAYAKDGNRERGWYLLYKGDPTNIETNAIPSSMSEGKLTQLTACLLGLKLLVIRLDMLFLVALVNSVCYLYVAAEFNLPYFIFA